MLAWRLLLTVFTAVLVAELADKTQLAVLAFSLRAGAARTIAGAIPAFAVVQAASVALGCYMGYRLPERAVRAAAGALFIAAGLLSLRREARRKRGAGAVAEVFTSVLLAELGDKTQLSSIAFAAATRAPLAVFAGSLAALSAVAAATAAVGGKLCERVPERPLMLASSALFIAAGMLTALGVL